MSLTNPLGAFLLRKWNPKVIILLGATIMSLSVIIASNVKSWWTFVVFYAIFFPAGIGLCYYPPIICGWEWFPNRKGLISGLVVGGYGFGAFLFGFISTAYVNPDDISPSKDPGDDTGDALFPKKVGERVPGMLKFCLIFWAILSVVAVCTISRNPRYLKKLELIERAKLLE